MFRILSRIYGTYLHRKHVSRILRHMYDTYLKTVGVSIPEQEHSGNPYHKVVIFTTKIGNHNTNNSKLLVVTIPEKVVL